MTNAEPADPTIIITAYQDAEAIPFLAQEIAASMQAAGLPWEALWIDVGTPWGA